MKSPMELFRQFTGASQPAAPGVTPPNPTDPSAVAPPTPAANQPSVDATKAATNTDPNADKFKELWAPADPKAQEGKFNLDTFFQLDPKAVQEQVSKLNFAQNITPEQLQAITAGGEGANKALLEAMNAVGQASFTQALSASAGIVKKAMTAADGSITERMQKQIKSETVGAAITESHPVLSNPEFAPIMNAVKSQFIEKYPTASPSEITALTKDYMIKFSDAAAGKKAAPEPTKGSVGTDWESWATAPTAESSVSSSF